MSSLAGSTHFSAGGLVGIETAKSYLPHLSNTEITTPSMRLEHKTLDEIVDNGTDIDSELAKKELAKIKQMLKR